MADLATADPRIRARTIAVAREAGHRRLRIALGVVAVPVVAAGALLVLHSPLLAARQVTVTGAAHTSVATVLAVTGLGHHPPLIDVNPAVDTAALERLPWVAHASVQPHWPSSVTVDVVERVPAVRVADGAGRVAIADRAGRVIAVVPSTSATAAGLVTLVPAGALAAPGAALGPSWRPALTVAGAMPTGLARHVVSVATVPGEGVVLRLVEGPLVIVGPATELGQKMISLATVISSVGISRVVTIDLRVPAAPVLTP